MSVCWKVGLNEILGFFQLHSKIIHLCKFGIILIFFDFAVYRFFGAWCLSPLNMIERLIENL